MLSAEQQARAIEALTRFVSSGKPEYIVSFNPGQPDVPCSVAWSLLFIPDGSTAEAWLSARQAEREARRLAREKRQSLEDYEGYGHAV